MIPLRYTPFPRATDDWKHRSVLKSYVICEVETAFFFFVDNRQTHKGTLTIDNNDYSGNTTMMWDDPWLITQATLITSKQGSLAVPGQSYIRTQYTHL